MPEWNDFVQNVWGRIRNRLGSDVAPEKVTSYEDYLFVDEHRLLNYLERFAGTNKVVKISEKSVGLSIKGPEVILNEKDKLTERQPYEMIHLLLDHLEEENSLKPRLEADTGQLVLEICTATRFIIPGNKQWESNPDDIAIWVAQSSNSLLCLIEHYRGQDSDTGPLLSEFSIFHSLLYALYVSGGKSPIHDQLGLPELGTADKEAVWRSSLEYIRSFANDPLSTLKQLGCTPSLARRIKVLYKVRVADEDYGSDNLNRSVFGYPVFISTA